MSNNVLQQSMDAVEDEVVRLQSACATLIKSAQVEIRDLNCLLKEAEEYKEKTRAEIRDLNYLLKEAEKYKERVQARDIMEKILPVISDIENDVLDVNDLEKLKMRIGVRFEQLSEALIAAGVTIWTHNRGDKINTDSNEVNNNCRLIETSNKELHGTVARVRKMGCVLEKEEVNPILEDIDLYYYPKQEQQPILESKETVENTDVTQLRKNETTMITLPFDIQLKQRFDKISDSTKIKNEEENLICIIKKGEAYKINDLIPVSDNYTKVGVWKIYNNENDSGKEILTNGIDKLEFKIQMDEIHQIEIQFIGNGDIFLAGLSLPNIVSNENQIISGGKL